MCNRSFLRLPLGWKNQHSLTLGASRVQFTLQPSIINTIYHCQLDINIELETRTELKPKLNLHKVLCHSRCDQGPHANKLFEGSHSGHSV